MKKFIPLVIMVLVGRFFWFRYYFNHAGEPCMTIIMNRETDKVKMILKRKS